MIATVARTRERVDTSHIEPSDAAQCLTGPAEFCTGHAHFAQHELTRGAHGRLLAMDGGR